MSLLLLFSSGTSAASPGVNATLVLNDLLPALHGEDYSSLAFWNEGDLYAFADTVAQRLARSLGGFVERDAATSVVVGDATYDVPARHVETLHLSVSTRALRPSNVAELEALDDDWTATAGTSSDPWPSRWVMEPGRETHRLYPVPYTGVSGAVAVVMCRLPVTVTSAAPTVRMPRVFRAWWRLRVLEAAREKEGEGQMPEVAEWCGQVAGLLEQSARELWQY